MSRPVVSAYAEELYARLAPIAYADEANEWALLYLCEAAAGLSIQEIIDFARADDTSDIHGLGILDSDGDPYLLGSGEGPGSNTPLHIFIDSVGDPVGAVDGVPYSAVFVDGDGDPNVEPVGLPGWGKVFDPDFAPFKALPYLAQFNGTVLPPRLTEDEQRTAIKVSGGWNRGTKAAIISVAQPHLTGTGTVLVVERYGSAYRFKVTTFASETADSSELQRAVLAQKPAGLVVEFATVTGGNFATLRDTHSDFADVRTTFTDFADVLSDPSQQ